VTRTLVVTGVDLMHFLLVFFSIFVTLAISGLVLFGRRLESFTTFPRAINTVFRLMLGDFDWDGIRSVGRMEGAIWLFLALSIMNLLLLNMVLAIVMDGYSEVKKGSLSADTLIQEIHQTFTRWLGVRRGKLIDLQTVNTALVMEERRFMTDRKESQSGGSVDGGPPRDKFDPRNEILLGKHTRAIRGMNVEHIDEDIREFVGPGKVSQDAGLLCRVLHDNGMFRDYSIGHDLRYELRYVEVPGAQIHPEELNQDEEELQSQMILYPVKFAKVVSDHCRKKMSVDQATELMTNAVTHYYKNHAAQVDIDGIRQNLRKVMSRTKKIKEVFRDGGGGQSMSMNAQTETKILRDYLRHFYDEVDKGRQQHRKETLSLRAGVLELYSRLHDCAPEVAIKMEDQLKESHVLNEDSKLQEGLSHKAPKVLAVENHFPARDIVSRGRGVNGHGENGHSKNLPPQKPQASLALIASAPAPRPGGRPVGREQRLDELKAEQQPSNGATRRGGETRRGGDARAARQLAEYSGGGRYRDDPRDDRGYSGKRYSSLQYQRGPKLSVDGSVLSAIAVEFEEDDAACPPPPLSFNRAPTQTRERSTDKERKDRKGPLPPNPDQSFLAPGPAGPGAARAVRSTPKAANRRLPDNNRGDSIGSAGDLDDDELLAEVDELLQRSADIRLDAFIRSEKPQESSNRGYADDRSDTGRRTRGGVYRPPPSR